MSNINTLLDVSITLILDMILTVIKRDLILFHSSPEFAFIDQCTVTRTYLFLHKFWFFSAAYYFGNWAFLVVSIHSPGII